MDPVSPFCQCLDLPELCTGPRSDEYEAACDQLRNYYTYHSNGNNQDCEWLADNLRVCPRCLGYILFPYDPERKKIAHASFLGITAEEGAKVFDEAMEHHGIYKKWRFRISTRVGDFFHGWSKKEKEKGEEKKQSEKEQEKLPLLDDRESLDLGMEY